MMVKRGNKSSLKKILIRGIVICLTIGWTFADGQDPALLKKTAFMHNIVVFTSWIRVILSMIAGKTMTNGLLYGGFFGLDVYLRQIWNMTKNIANFGLGFVFLVVVIKEVFQFKIQDSILDISKKLGWFVIGGLLIQASWFIILALISLSTVIATAVAAFPAMVIQSDSTRGSNIIQTVNQNGALQGSTYTIKNSNTGSPKNLSLQYTTGVNNISNEETLDFLMPRYDNLGGPLYFMGLSVVGFQNYTSFSPTTSTDLKTVLTGLIIKLLITAGYACALLIIILINIARIIKIWIYIALLPLNIVLRVFKKEKILEKDDMSVGWAVGTLDRGGLIQMICQPIIIMGVMGIAMIMITGFWSVLGSTSNVNTDAINAAYGVTIDSTSTHSQFITDSVDVQTMGDIVNSNMTGGLLQSLILIGLVFGLMALIIYISAAVTKEKWLQDITKSAAKLMTQIPFMPITSKVSTFAGGLNKASGGKLGEAYDRFKSGAGLGLDAKAATDFAQWAGVSDPNTIHKLKYQIKTAKSFNELQAATESRYAQQDKKDFQEIFNSEGRKTNFIKYYNQLQNKPLGSKVLEEDTLASVFKNKEDRDKLKTILFPSINGKTTIKGFDENSSRVNGGTETPPDDSKKEEPKEKK